MDDKVTPLINELLITVFVEQPLAKHVGLLISVVILNRPGVARAVLLTALSQIIQLWN